MAGHGSLVAGAGFVMTVLEGTGSMDLIEVVPELALVCQAEAGSVVA